MASQNPLREWFPNVKLPIIMSAPMFGAADGTLAARVSKAGGFGFIPGGFDFSAHSAQLAALAKELATARSILGLTEMTLTPAPIGVGFLTWHESVVLFRQNVMPILEKYLPQAVWLFAPGPAGDAHADIIAAACRARGLRVFVQAGSVAAARAAARGGADAVVAQGADAGGHQLAGAAGVVSLVPEVRRMLRAEAPAVAVVAAGGIAHAHAVVAAVALGADGVAMGTKFLPAKECLWPEEKKRMVLEAEDGATSTVKSTFHDDIVGNQPWPKLYDGRALITDSYRDHIAGLPLEENLAKFKDAAEAGDTSRAMTWCGTGVGLVNDAIPAADIVTSVREEAKRRLQAIRFAFDEDGKEEEKSKSLVKQLGHMVHKLK